MGSPGRKEKTIESITDLVNNRLAGKIPKEVASYFCGANLFGAKKKDGGIRPIAVGEILRRLVSKAAMRALSKKDEQLLSPLQLGVGVRGGCETVVHALREAMKDDNSFVLQVDFKNAFNLANRGTTYNELLNHFPELAHWVSTCYGVKAILNFGNEKLTSSTGFHQGDPLATLLFSINLQKIVLRIEQETPNLKQNSWILDDGVLVGGKEDIRKALKIIEEDGPGRGLNLSTAATPGAKSKTSIWCPSSSPQRLEKFPIGMDIPVMDGSGFTHLGAPMGDEAFTANNITEKVDKVKTILVTLASLKDAHFEYVLLRSCFSMPKMTYLMRTTSPSLTNLSVWRRFDGELREALGRLLGNNLEQEAWDQAKLPVSMSGMGLRSTEEHASAAFLGSILDTETESKQY